MATCSIRGHFDGDRILLDKPFDLQPNARLLITVLADDDEREEWRRVSLAGLESAYSDIEPEYGLSAIRELNEEYE